MKTNWGSDWREDWTPRYGWGSRMVALLAVIGLDLCSALTQEHPVWTWTAGSFTDGVPGNDNHRWDNPANWNPAGVPPPHAVAVINSGQPDATALGEFNQYGVDLNGGRLTSAGLTVAVLNHQGGELAGTNKIAALGGAWNWSAGRLYGTCRIEAGATLNYAGAGEKAIMDGAVVDTYGTVNWLGPFPLWGRCYNGSAALNVRDGATFHLLAGGAAFDRQYANRDFNVLMSPAAVLRKSAGTNSMIGSIVLDLRGEVRMDMGELTLNTRTYLADGARFTGQGTVRLVGNQVDLDGQLVLEGVRFHQQAGNFSMTGDGGFLTTSGGGLYEWSGGWLYGSLTLTAQSRALFTGTADKVFADSASLQNYGTIAWTGGLLRARCYSGPATLRNYAGARFTCEGGTALTREFGNRSATFTVDVGAAFTKTDAGNVNADWVFNQNGTFSQGGGALWLRQGGSSSGSYTNLNGAVLGFGGGTHVLQGDLPIVGAGEARLTAGEVQLNGTLRLQGVNLRHSGGNLNGTGAGGTVETTDGAVHEWSGGWLLGTVTLTNDTTAVFSGGGEKRFGDYAVLHNYGTITWTGGLLRARCYNGPATLANHAGARFVCEGGTGLTREFGNRSATFTVDAGAAFTKTDAGSVNADWVFNQNGTFSQEAGALWLYQG
ncbi:MAG: hypothetical protein FJ387_24360, partial [Verrucomicrobia bacterium]|nr:hypothetical protein [Verrucomicrobiota bacterium]